MSEEKKQLKILVHDIRNQLCIVQASNDLAMKLVKTDPDKALLLLAKMKSGVDKLQEILVEALDSPDVSCDLKTELKLLQLDISANYDLNITVTGEKEFIISCKKTDIARVFDNIAKNAKEANARSLSAHINEQGVLFSDDGDGMNDSTLKILNSGNKTSTKEKGHGLGTQMLREFCLANGLELKFAKKRKNILDENKAKGTHIIMRRIKNAKKE